MKVEFTKSKNSPYFNMCFVDDLSEDEKSYQPYINEVSKVLKEKFDSFDRLNDTTSVRFKFNDIADEAAFILWTTNNFVLKI
jgi:hypothetical protein